MMRAPPVATEMANRYDISGAFTSNARAISKANMVEKTTAKMEAAGLLRSQICESLSISSNT